MNASSPDLLQRSLCITQSLCRLALKEANASLILIHGLSLGQESNHK